MDTQHADLNTKLDTLCAAYAVLESEECSTQDTRLTNAIYAAKIQLHNVLAELQSTPV